MWSDKNHSFDVEDRLLAHVRVVVMNKLRRNESFMLQVPGAHGIGYHSLWVSPAVPLVFHFYGSRPPALDGDLIQAMMHDASGPDGLTLSPELGAVQTK